MSVYISLLRGINVGGSKLVSMDILCDLYSSLDFSPVRTYLQSGNVIFSSKLTDRALLTSQIETRIEQLCGFHVTVFIRNDADFERILAGNPFPDQGKRDPGRLHVSFLYHAPVETAWKKLDLPSDIPDKLARGDQAIYLYFPNGSAKSRISTSYLERVLGVPITDRNWNTVNALYRMALEM